ncbi:MAG TPA: 3-dehydroquinate synthase [Candidatus Acidoferrum sp.]
MKTARSQRIAVRSSGGSYEIVCRRALLARTAEYIAPLGKFSSVHVISSPRVWRVLGKRVLRSFTGRSRPLVHLFDDAEAAKSLSSVEALARKLVRGGADRKALLVAVGGGVVGDVAGFVAASYLRGIALVQIPTTLVAQVDSSVGGKTGVNLPEGKNLVGAFYPPKLVLVDPDALATLPEREFRGGLAEVIKYGVIADRALFAFLEANLDAILRRDARALLHVIHRSLSIKARVVSADEREAGLREILNFGHTFGHVLESVTRYKRYQHGEAVAWGMMCAALLSHEVLKTPAQDVSRIIALTRRVGPFPSWPSASPSAQLHAMRSDKKTRGGKLRFVLTPGIGRARSCDDAPEKAVLCILRHAPQLAGGPLSEIEKCHG